MRSKWRQLRGWMRRAKGKTGLCSWCWRLGVMDMTFTAYDTDGNPLKAHVYNACDKHIKKNLRSFTSVPHDMHVEFESGASLHAKNIRPVAEEIEFDLPPKDK